VYDLRHVVGDGDASPASNPTRTAATASAWAGPGTGSRRGTAIGSTTVPTSTRRSW
jgi:hypothetical protein